MANDGKRAVAACQAAERSQWKIGDALLEECGPPSESTAILEQVAKVLEREGMDYSVHRLSQLRAVAHAFPPHRRHYDLAWITHREAETPEFLDNLVAVSGESPVTYEQVLQIRKEQERREEAQRLKEVRATRATRAAAKKEKADQKALADAHAAFDRFRTKEPR